MENRMEKKFTQTVQGIQKRYSFEIEKIAIPDMDITSCLYLVSAGEGYWVNDAAGLRVHRVTPGFKLSKTLNLESPAGGLYDDSKGGLYFCEPGSRSVFKYSYADDTLTLFSTGVVNFICPRLVTGDSDGALYISDNRNTVWKTTGDSWKRLAAYEGIEIRYLKVADNRLFLFDGNEKKLYCHNLEGELQEILEFSGKFREGFSMVGFEMDTRNRVFYMSELNRLFKFGYDGQMIYVKNLVDVDHMLYDVRFLSILEDATGRYLYMSPRNSRAIFRIPMDTVKY